MYTWRSSYISNNFDSHCLWRLCVWSLFCNALPRALTWVLKTGVPEPSLPKVGLPTYHKEYIASFKKQELQQQKFDMYRENLKNKKTKKKHLNFLVKNSWPVLKLIWKNGHWVTLHQNFSNYLDLSKNMTTRVELGFY